ncbi:MAG: sensor histidine kinase [Bacteroidota bacterium]
MPDEDQVHMFERFFRAKNVTNIQGTGLGLSIVKRYVDLMQGDITFSSVYQEGTTFSLRFSQPPK